MSSEKTKMFESPSPQSSKDVIPLGQPQLNDVFQLIHRNAHLEAELKFANIRRAEAESASQYLLIHLSAGVQKHGTSRGDASLAGPGPPLVDYYSDGGLGSTGRYGSGTKSPETSQRKPVGSTPIESRDSGASQQRCGGTRDYGNVPATPINPEDDLLSFEDREPACTYPNRSAWSATPHPQGNDYGTSAVFSARAPASFQDSIGVGVRAAGTGDGEASGYARAKAAVIPPTPTPAAGPVRWSGAFAAHEITRLKNSACFTEAMDPEEYQSHWTGYASMFPRHAAAEWKAFYERFVRPEYRRKQAEVQGTVDRLLEDAEVGRADEASEVLKHEAPEPPIVAGKANTSTELEGQAVPIDGRWGLGVDRSKLRLLDVTAPLEGTSVSQDRWVKLDISSETADLVSTEMQPTVPPASGEVSLGLHSEPPLKPRLALTAHHNTNNHNTSDSGTAIMLSANPVTPPAIQRSQHGPQDVSQLAAPGPRAGGKGESFRTIIIEGVPRGTSLGDVLDKVFGGALQSAKVMRTAGMKTTPRLTTDTAMVVFLRGRGARQFRDACRDQPITFTTSTGTVVANVVLLASTTRPLAILSRQKIRAFGMSRVLFIHDPPCRMTPQQVVDALREDDSIPDPVKYGYDADGPDIMTFEFASIEHAKMAFDFFHQHGHILDGVDKGFLPDTCDRDDQDHMVGEESENSDEDAEWSAGEPARAV